jgi:membrane dipeptidase
MTLTHFNTNHWADSATDAPKHHGLTPFGEEVVRAMNRLGMLVDLSHASDETFYAVARVSKAPLFASHSSARALCDVPRNMSDDMLAAVGKSKGVVMTNFLAMYLDADFAAQRKAGRATAAVPLSKLVDHIEHMVKDAVDFPVGVEDISKLPAVDAELRRRGHSDDDVAKIMGENFLRVLAETERIARERQADAPDASAP